MKSDRCTITPAACVGPSLCELSAGCLRARVPGGIWCRGSHQPAGDPRWMWEVCPHCEQQISTSNGRLLPHTLELVNDPDLVDIAKL